MRIFAPYRAVVACRIGGLVVALGACSPKTGSKTIPGALTNNTFAQVSGAGTNIAVSTYGLPVVPNSALGIYLRI